jgi:DNA-binding winged helix-turn-helix (wHTH) protein
MQLTDGRDPDENADGSLTNSRSQPATTLNGDSADEFMLAGWRVRPLQNRLSSAAGEIVLEPKAMDVLVALAAARGQTVSREDLLNLVWPNVFVADDSLHRAVSRLRRALSQHRELSEAVITVPRRGYRLNTELLAVPLERILNNPSRNRRERRS